MKWLTVLSVVVVLVSGCRNKEPEVVTMDDLIPTSEHYRDGEEVTDSSGAITPSFIPRIDPTKLSEQGILLDEARPSDSLSFPDRFSPVSSEKFSYMPGNEVTYYNRWSFKDSATSVNVFLNWMNCFGRTCISSRIGEVKNMQRDAFLLLVNDTNVVYISGSDSREILKWKKLYTEEKNTNCYYLLTQRKQGKVSWSTCREGTLFPLKAPEEFINE